VTALRVEMGTQGFLAQFSELATGSHYEEAGGEDRRNGGRRGTMTEHRPAAWPDKVK